MSNRAARKQKRAFRKITEGLFELPVHPSEPCPPSTWLPPGAQQAPPIEVQEEAGMIVFLDGRTVLSTAETREVWRWCQWWHFRLEASKGVT